MNRHFRTILRSLLILIVAIGPLQAQTMFACSMMETVKEACCCDDHQTNKERFDSDGDSALGLNEVPCCEQLVELQVDEDARQDAQVVNQSEIRSDLDPPQTIVIPVDTFATPRGCATVLNSQLQPIAYHSGSDTYLITQRLRI